LRLGAEGATAPETLRQKDREGRMDAGKSASLAGDARRRSKVPDPTSR
jgi:hypothetical protein